MQPDGALRILTNDGPLTVPFNQFRFWRSDEIGIHIVYETHRTIFPWHRILEVSVTLNSPEYREWVAKQRQLDDPEAPPAPFNRACSNDHQSLN